MEPFRFLRALVGGEDLLLPYRACQQLVAELNVGEMIASSSMALTVLCQIYVVILSVFRILFFENDSYSNSVLQILACTVVIIVRLSTSWLPRSIEIYAQALVMIISFCFVSSLHKYYVSGCRYKPMNLSGRVHIITGSNTGTTEHNRTYITFFTFDLTLLLTCIGIGYETAKHIVAMGGTVILACRSVEKGEVAKERIQRITKCNKGSVIVMHLDLSVLSSVREFAEIFRAMRLPLHVLINNAGIMLSNRHVTEDGFEKVFSVNYLGHFLLTNMLLPELEKVNGRVVNVASTMHKLIRAFNFDNVMAEKGFSLFGTYGQSKLAIILFTKELQKR
jgi:NAD(P)-dependent dehydrogenase (short-subunit alcohol dehydrogenase family)